MTFGITPVDNTPVEDDGFPNFMQFYSVGVPLGGPDATAIDFGPGLAATRGVGENANLITIDAASGIQWQDNGFDLGGPDVSVVNLQGPTVTATRESGSDTLNLFFGEGQSLTWREVFIDDEITADDIDNGIAVMANSGSVNIVVGANVIPPGRSVLVLQQGGATVNLVTSTADATLLYRMDTFLPQLGGPGAIVTLIARDATTVVLCGDLAPDF